MLQQLLACRDLQDLTAVGMQLADNTGIAQLQHDILDARLVFDSTCYWSKDQLNIFSDSELIAKTVNEPMEQRTLHMLQILLHCCPATRVNVTRLLRRTTG